MPMINSASWSEVSAEEELIALQRGIEQKKPDTQPTLWGLCWASGVAKTSLIFSGQNCIW